MGVIVRVVEGFACEPSYDLGVMKGRVLLVDDEPGILSVLQRFFDEKYDLVVASNGSDALRLLESGEEFDVILCDVILPYLNGMSLYKKLAQTQPDVAERIIFMTGGALSPAVASFFVTIKNKTFDKPFDLFELEAAVEAAMKARGK